MAQRKKRRKKKQPPKKKRIVYLGTPIKEFPLVKHKAHGIGRDVGSGPSWHGKEWRVVYFKNGGLVRVPFEELKYRHADDRAEVVAEVKAERKAARRAKSNKGKT